MDAALSFIPFYDSINAARNKQWGRMLFNLGLDIVPFLKIGKIARLAQLSKNPIMRKLPYKAYFKTKAKVLDALPNRLFNGRYELSDAVKTGIIRSIVDFTPDAIQAVPVLVSQGQTND